MSSTPEEKYATRKNTTSKEEIKMAKARKGDLFSCELCGLVVAVDESCDCVVGELICCDIPMEKGKEKMKKATKPAAKAKKPVQAKKVKAAPKKVVKPVKKTAKPKAKAKPKAAAKPKATAKAKPKAKAKKK
jgi:hypothetical protein